MASKEVNSGIEPHQEDDIESSPSRSEGSETIAEKVPTDIKTDVNADLEAVDLDDIIPTYDEKGEIEEIHKPAGKDDILTHTLHVQDDPTLSALTFRTAFLG